MDIDAWLAGLGLQHYAAVFSANGTRGKSYAMRFGAQYCCTDYEEMLKDESIDAVIILTRNQLHASQTLAALRAGIENVIIPRLNEKDLFDLPEEVKQKLRFTLAENVDEVLAGALEQNERVREVYLGGAEA